MNADAQRVGPVSLSERIVFIDVVRGMALFGILAANMRAFFAPLDAYDNIQALYHGRADLIAQVFIDIFIQGKFITIFSFLFGLGFAIQMSRAEARGARFLGFLSSAVDCSGHIWIDPRNLHLGGRCSAHLCAFRRNFAALSKSPAKDAALVGGWFVFDSARAGSLFLWPLFHPLAPTLDESESA